MTAERGASGTGQRGALATGLRTLELLVASHNPLGVTEIADQLELDKANAHRTLAALVRLGYVEQDSVHAPLQRLAQGRGAGTGRARVAGPDRGRGAAPQVAVGGHIGEHAPGRARG